MRELQTNTGYYGEFDNEVLDTVSGVSSSTPLEELIKIRAIMWLEYTGALLKEIRGLLGNLLKNLGDVKSMYAEFVKEVEEYEKLWGETDETLETQKEISKIKTLFNDVHLLFKKIKTNENILMRDGKIKFLKLYLSEAGIITAFLGVSAIALKISDPLFLVGTLFVFLVVAYFLTRLYLGRGVA